MRLLRPNRALSREPGLSRRCRTMPEFAAALSHGAPGAPPITSCTMPGQTRRHMHPGRRNTSDQRRRFRRAKAYPGRGHFLEIDARRRVTGHGSETSRPSLLARLPHTPRNTIHSAGLHSIAIGSRHKCPSRRPGLPVQSRTGCIRLCRPGLPEDHEFLSGQEGQLILLV